MSFFERLQSETLDERHTFTEIPVIRRAVCEGVSRDLYLAFLAQAYHHVKHTCSLLALAASRCGDVDRAYQMALFEYIDEEKGHEQWILDDIAAMGGQRDAVAASEPDIPCRVMVGYAYYAIERISPYCLLGMVYVLEGMSILLARDAAASIARSLEAGPGTGGFSYLNSHGALDEKHMEFFARLVDGINDPVAQDAILSTAIVMYRLYGDIFRGLSHI